MYAKHSDAFMWEDQAGNTCNHLDVVKDVLDLTQHQYDQRRAPVASSYASRLRDRARAQLAPQPTQATAQ